VHHDLVNHGLAFDQRNLFISCRNDGTVRKVTRPGRPRSSSKEWASRPDRVQRSRTLFVGDRAGGIFAVDHRGLRGVSSSSRPAGGLPSGVRPDGTCT